MSEDPGTFEPRPPSPTIEELDEGSRALIAEALEVAQALGLPENIRELSDLFTERRAHWFGIPEAERPHPDDFITAVSALVAQRLALTLALDWVMYTDEDGTVLALMAPAEQVHADQNLYIFPLEGIAARWPEDGEGEVLAYYEGVVEHVRGQLRS